MLSYIVSQSAEEKSLPPRSLKLNHNHNLNLTSVGEAKPMADTDLRVVEGNQNKNGNNVEMIDETTHERTQVPKNCEVIISNQNLHSDTDDTINSDKQINKIDGGNNVCEKIESKIQAKKSRISKVGAKNTTLKRVSFGSSKGSMVETLIFETPTPLSEHAERVFSYLPDNTTTATVPSEQHGQHKISSSSTQKTIRSTNDNNNRTCLDDSGIDLQEESETSKVRVTFFQSNKPQQISPPDSYLFYSDSSTPLLPESYLTDISNNFLTSEMEVETTAQISYDRQISTESGWDNPFRPGGDLSREADEIVNLIKGGKPITPTCDVNQSVANGNAQKDLASSSIKNGTAVCDETTKKEALNLQSIPAQNGTKSSQSKSNLKNSGGKSTSQTQVSNQVVPGPTSASHVVIQDKKKKKCNCCVIQ